MQKYMSIIEEFRNTEKASKLILNAIKELYPTKGVSQNLCKRTSWCKREVKRGGEQGSCSLPCVHVNIKSSRRSRAAATAAVRQHLPLTAKGFYVIRAYDPRNRS